MGTAIRNVKFTKGWIYYCHFQAKLEAKIECKRNCYHNEFRSYLSGIPIDNTMNYNSPKNKLMMAINVP